MNQDYVTQLRLQLREAALREERRVPLARRAVRMRHGLPGPAPLAAALAVALFALAVAIGVVQLRRDSAPVKPKVVHTFTVAGSLGSLSGGFGAAWASDPVTGRVLRDRPEDAQGHRAHRHRPPLRATPPASRPPARCWRWPVPTRCGRSPATC